MVEPGWDGKWENSVQFQLLLHQCDRTLPCVLCPQLYITFSTIFALPFVGINGACSHQAQRCHLWSGVRAEASVSSALCPSCVLEHCWTCHPACKCIQRAQEPSQVASKKGGRLPRYLQACVSRPQESLLGNALES